MAEKKSNFSVAIVQIFKGGKRYQLWMACLTALVLIGVINYMREHISEDLITTAMRDQVPWGYFIANYIFFVGVAAAAILLVIPAYLYDFKPIKEIVLFGEMAAIVATIMAMLFVTVDLGQPLRLWHLFPLLGAANLPSSVLVWNVLFLNGYVALNLFLVGYAIYRIWHRKEYKLSIIWPLILLSIPWAISIHTSTAFVFNGLSSRPFWNASILAPRFLASAFCSGPAIMLIVLQVIRRFSKIEIEDKAIFKIAELVAYAMGINLFLLCAELFKEFYSGSIHKLPIEYLYFGLHGKGALVPWIWMSLVFNLIAFVLFLIPTTREKYLTLNIGAVLVVLGVYIEKGLGLVIPGFVPDVLGEIYEYWPTLSETLITIGILALGALLYTIMVKFTIPVYTGEIPLESKEG